MHKSATALIAYAGLATAQDNTIEFFWPHAATWEVPTITIQSANATATTLRIGCPSKQKSRCEWGHMNYTIFGQSTYEATMTNATYSVTRTCVAKQTPSVDCYMEGSDEGGLSMFSGQERWFADASNEVVATVDAGAEKLGAAPTGAAQYSPVSGVIATPSATDSTQSVGAAGFVRAEIAVVFFGVLVAVMHM